MPLTLAEKSKEAKERALRIKQLQEEALEKLPAPKLYVVLFLRNDPPTANNFHWGFYYHQHKRGGTKYHMRNVNNGWMPDHATTGGVFKSNFLCVIIQIGTIPGDKEQQLDQTMRTYDANANDIPGITCRVWIFKILALLVQCGLVRCDNLQTLQEECLAFGNQYMNDAAKNNQPRPFVVSRHCS